MAAAATLVGVYMVYFFSSWAKKNAVFFISFAAGVLLANAFFHLLPEAVNLVSSWPFWILGMFVLLYLFEHSFIIHSCREEHCKAHTLGFMGLFGICFHSLIDGLIIGIAFKSGFFMGALISLAIIFHKVAEGVCVYSLLVGDEFSRSKSLIYSWFVALAAPLGALAAYFGLKGISDSFQGGLLAAAAGVFIYIGASDLLPETHKKSNLWNAIFFLAGIVFILALKSIG